MSHSAARLRAWRVTAVAAALIATSMAALAPTKAPATLAREATPRAVAAVASASTFAKRFDAAVEAIRATQQPAGYFLTLHTPRPSFAAPTSELNTFTPAVLVSLVEPVASETRLSDVVGRARTYLRGQIEDTGLVRYHGRPDQPHLPGLGCEITPDADDTALAWTFAPATDVSRAASAVALVGQYRTDEGLYRTWLAPLTGYKCLDPGRDPNPPDVAINMHLYLFFARFAPANARELCGALQRTIEQDRIWVYYEAAPLVPLLREPDLARAGCPLRVPERRLRGLPEGQDAYIKLARVHRALALRDGPMPPRDEVMELLAGLADSAFARVRATPPLLYHNDFTASTPRFYWSPEVGLALWLRVYVEAARTYPTDLPMPSTRPPTR